jgi:hypothetical protein
MARSSPVGKEKRMNKLINCLAIVALVAGCGSDVRSHDQADVTKPATIILKKNAEQGAVHSLSVVGSGELDGNAEITLILNGEPYKTETLSGKVDFRWRGDWYSDQAEIRYTPASVTGGSLKLKYEFND